MTTTENKQYGYMSSANRYIKNYEKKYGKRNWAINQLDEGCYEVIMYPKEYIERVTWESIRQDCKLPSEDNNQGFIYGINFVDFENEGGIIDVQWFETSEEREVFISINNFIDLDK